MTRIQQQQQQFSRSKRVLTSGILPEKLAAASLWILLLLCPFNKGGDPTTATTRAWFAHGFGVVDPTTIAFHAAHTLSDPLVRLPAIADAIADHLPTVTVAATAADIELFGVPASSASPALPPSETWGLRFVSGLLTYFGFVVATDRPRGRLGVPLAAATGDNNNSGDEGFLRVGPSGVPGAGLGLFAIRSMPAGTVLGTYPGVVLPLEQHASSSKVRNCPGCASYIWRFTDNRFVIDPTDHSDGTLGEVCAGGNPSQPLSVPFFGALSALGIWRGVPTALCRINEPPKGKDVNVVTEENLETRTVTFALERDVFAGEELHIDYGLTYDRTGYGGSAQ